MKKPAIFTLLLALCLSLNSCFFIPLGPLPATPDDLGTAQTFEKAGITLILTDKFQETQSEQGFDAYYTSDFCGVTVLKESFASTEGLADQSLEEYIKGFLSDIGHSTIEPQNHDGLWYYVKYSNNRCVYCYVYKGSDAFYIVQYIMNTVDEVDLQNTIHEWAKATLVT